MKSHIHYHARKRVEPYPARSPWLRLLDQVIYVVGVVGPLMTLPQLMLIFNSKNATGVSPESWLAWAILDIPWIIYGVAHKEPPIVFTYTAWFFCNLAVFVGAVMY